MGSVEDFSNFINAVIDEKKFWQYQNYIDNARESADAEIIVGGACDKSNGYFIQPTVIGNQRSKVCNHVRRNFWRYLRFTYIPGR